MDDVVNDFLEIADKYDGFVFGSPVYYASANGAMIAFMDRVFYADGNAGKKSFYLKPAASVIDSPPCRHHRNIRPDEQILHHK